MTDKTEETVEGTPLIEKDPVLVDINKKIVEAFDIFDHESNKTADVREVGTIIRSLGCYPSEAELQDMIQEVEEEEPTGFIRLDKFQPMMARVMLEKRYQPSSEEIILKAFEVLDQDRKSYLTEVELKKFMTEEGEAFTPEELEEFLTAAVDQEKGVVQYREFVTTMLPDSEQN
ncbi:dynein regulatory complex protein 8-like [Halichondria panicea]|uniref:dynein regulatory complex protein 8-like n=1 Tax=Halichondria panicea TaxID=6063 RepID=UPI00312B6D55